MTAALPRYEPPERALAPDGLAAPFWAAVQQGGLALPRCSVCGRWQWYPESAATDCPGGTLQWEPVATTGMLYSFTRVHRSFLPGAGKGGQQPYVVGLVDLDGVDGPHLVLTVDDGSPLTVGARGRVAFVPHGERLHPVFVADDPTGDGPGGPGSAAP